MQQTGVARRRMVRGSSRPRLGQDSDRRRLHRHRAVRRAMQQTGAARRPTAQPRGRPRPGQASDRRQLHRRRVVHRAMQQTGVALRLVEAVNLASQRMPITKVAAPELVARLPAPIRVTHETTEEPLAPTAASFSAIRMGARHPLPRLAALLPEWIHADAW